MGATLHPVEACVAGDIAALTKLGSAETGDTVSAATDPCCCVLEPARAAAARSRSPPAPGATRTRWCKTLAKIVAADPTLRLERNQETHQTVLWCMGEAHADVVLSRLRAGGAEVDTEPVQVADARDDRQARAGDRAPRQAVRRPRPVRRVPRRVRAPAARRRGSSSSRRSSAGRCRRSTSRASRRASGPSSSAGCPTRKHPAVDLKATLVDGKAHSVDSSDAAFQTAGALALREAARRAGWCCSSRSTRWRSASRTTTSARCWATCPDAAGACSARRSPGLGRTVVRAEVPCTELIRYAVDLRAMTSGAASFTRRRARYEVAPT